MFSHRSPFKYFYTGEIFNVCKCSQTLWIFWTLFSPFSMDFTVDSSSILYFRGGGEYWQLQAVLPTVAVGQESN